MSRRPGWPRRLAPAGAGAALVALSLAAGGVLGGFSAGIANKADSAATGTLLAASGGCPTSSPGVPSTCTSTATPAAFGTPSSVALTSPGTLTPTGATVSARSCGAVQLQDATAGNAPLLVRNSVAYAPTGGRWTDAGAVTLSSGGYATSPLSETGSASNLQSFSVGIWLKYVSGASGSLLSFESIPVSGSSSTHDRVLDVLATGAVAFTAGPNVALFTGPMTAGWHLVVGTVSTLTVAGIGVTETVSVDVDGGTAATVTGVLGQPGTAAGFWSLGNSSGVSGPSGPYSGTMSDAFVVPGVLTAANQNALATAGSQATFASRLGAYSPTHFWPLNDNGTSTYTGTVPSVGGVAPCSQAQATVTLGASSTTYSTISAWVAVAAPFTTLSAYTPLGVSAARASGFVTTSMPGLHLAIGISVQFTVGGFSATLLFASGDLVLS